MVHHFKKSRVSWAGTGEKRSFKGRKIYGFNPIHFSITFHCLRFLSSRKEPPKNGKRALVLHYKKSYGFCIYGEIYMVSVLITFHCLWILSSGKKLLKWGKRAEVYHPKKSGDPWGGSGSLGRSNIFQRWKNIYEMLAERLTSRF